MRFEGIYTPVITQFQHDFSIDRDALAGTVEHLIACGVHGLIVARTTVKTIWIGLSAAPSEVVA